MSTYALSHLSDLQLVRALHTLVAQDRTTTASLLAHLAEVDERRLYAPAGYPSMLAYCVGELRFSEDAAYKRIRAARAARRFPAIYTAVTEGRLHLSAVVMLAAYLSEENAADLLASAVSKTKSELEYLLAERFPQADFFTLVQPLGAMAPSTAQLAPPMKTGCQGAWFCDPFPPWPSLTSRLFGVRLLPQVLLRTSRVPHGDYGLYAHGAKPGSPAPDAATATVTVRVGSRRPRSSQAVCVTAGLRR